MAVETVAVEVWVMLDENGEYAAGTDPDALHEVYDNEVGGDRDTLSIRRVKFTVNIPLPRVIELTGTAGDEPAAGELRAM